MPKKKTNPLEEAAAISSCAGTLYLVATPIGNLADFSWRGVETLRNVALIAAEDTRHTRYLLDHYGIGTPMLALHDHNEDSVARRLIEKLQGGESIALVSDAGSPLISDPGYPLVRQARAAGITVSPIPGACALIAGLSASGLPCERFVFEGFLPRQAGARRERLAILREETRTAVCYEASHRILPTLRDLAAIYPEERGVTIARELTKRHETIINSTAGKAFGLVETDDYMQKGEFVLILEGAPPLSEDTGLTAKQRETLKILLSACTIKTAASLAARLTGASRSLLYAEALKLNGTVPASNKDDEESDSE